MSHGTPYTARCFCGAVQFEVAGEPAAMGYCHCESCRQRPRSTHSHCGSRRRSK
jgi:hypothetical protein